MHFSLFLVPFLVLAGADGSHRLGLDSRPTLGKEQKEMAERASAYLLWEVTRRSDPRAKEKNLKTARELFLIWKNECLPSAFKNKTEKKAEFNFGTLIRGYDWEETPRLVVPVDEWENYGLILTGSLMTLQNRSREERSRENREALLDFLSGK